MRHFLQEDTLASIFNAFVKPYVDYGILTWGGTTNTHLLKLNRTLNKAMRIMAFRSKYESVKPLDIYYKILPLEANIKLNQERFIWKLTQNSIQIVYKPFITLTQAHQWTKTKTTIGIFYHLLELILAELHLLTKE